MRELNANELGAVAGGTWGCFSWFWSWCKPACNPCAPKPSCEPKPSCGTPSTPPLN